MGKVIGCVYNHIQWNWIHPTPNTTFVIPKFYVYTTTYVTTGGSNVSKYHIIKTKTLSKPNTNNCFDVAINVDDSSQYFTTTTTQKIRYNYVCYLDTWLPYWGIHTPKA